MDNLLAVKVGLVSEHPFAYAKATGCETSKMALGYAALGVGRHHEEGYRILKDWLQR